MRGKKKKAKGKAKASEALDDAGGLIDLKKFERNMNLTVEALNTTYSQLRTGMPSPSLLDGK